MENSRISGWVNQLSLWPFSSSQTVIVITRGHGLWLDPAASSPDQAPGGPWASGLQQVGAEFRILLVEVIAEGLETAADRLGWAVWIVGEFADAKVEQHISLIINTYSGTRKSHHLCSHLLFRMELRPPQAQKSHTKIFPHCERSTNLSF